MHRPGPVRAASSGFVCLAAWGRLADRGALARLAGAPGDAPLEALLASRYRQVGVQLAGEIQGTVCAVLWDGERRRLLALRDRLGVSGGPFWAEADDGRLLVAATAADVARASSRTPEPDLGSLVLHLHGRGPLPGRTFYAGVAEVPAGGAILATDGGVELRRYWSVEPAPDGRGDVAWAEELRELLLAIGRDWAPEGAAAVSLSGGLDSPTVAAALRRSSPDAALSAVHRTTPALLASGESERAREVARHLGLPLEEVDGVEHWCLREADEPLAGPDSPYRPPYAEAWDATFRRTAAQGANSLYTGAGGDHLFFGPRAFRYADLLLGGRWMALARELWRHPAPRPSARRIVVPALHAALPGGLVAGRHAVPWLPRDRRRDWARAFSALRPAGPPSRRELTRSLRDDALPVVMTALAVRGRRYGIELLHPLLDHRLVELAARLPPEQAARRGVRKRVLREAVRPWLPAAVVDHREKILPTEILDRGLRERETRRVWNLLSGMRAAEAGLVDERRLRRGYEEYLAGRGDFRFWHAVTLESWLRHWF